VLLGKALAGFFFGIALALVILAPLAVVSGTSVANPVLTFIAIAFSSLTFSALGVLVSAYAKWVPEAQMLSNFLRFPMAFLSGTFVPLESLPSQLQVVSRFLPLTYSVEALRISMNNSAVTVNYLLDILVMALFFIVLLLLATKILQRRLE
jgi:ABC-type multidrug transport system permease subunit